MNLQKDLNFNKDPITPKYIQIVDSLKDNITKGKIKINQELPSINFLLSLFDIASYD